MERPLIIPLIALAAGITIAYHLPVQEATLSSAAAFCLLIVFISLRKGKYYQALMGIYILFFS
ncbi:MAG: hypothetical protein N2Z74_08935, partial [Syntrophales bacterium]|nr:hypothetical protein [Syntrophales bacterium]